MIDAVVPTMQSYTMVVYPSSNYKNTIKIL